jgi:hypothetical protein
MMWALNDAVGDDLGLYETWGLDKTFYYAIQVEYALVPAVGTANYASWAYADGSGTPMETNYFFYAAEMLDDKALAAIRMQQLNAIYGKDVTWTDILGYKKEYVDLSMDDVSLALDWQLEACDGFIARDTFDDYGLVVGVMGGDNGFGQHAHMDSGAFLYVNHGFEWFPDLGMDNYNIYEHFGYGIRQHYYRISTEGHNLVTITSQLNKIPFGQLSDGGGVVETFYSGGDAGMYAVLDNSGAYGAIANYARRGMLLTNNRTTTVIQDEIAFKGVESCVWIAHTRATIVLSPDGKTAYLTQLIGGKQKCIRVTLLSDNSRFKFEIMTCGVGQNDFIYNETHRLGWSEKMGGVSERGRGLYKRLVIKAENVLLFNCAIVIESVESSESGEAVKYDYTTISKWKVSDKYTGNNVDSGDAEDNSVISSAKMTDIKTYTAQAAKLIDSGYAFSTRTVDFFKSLARVTVAVNTYRPESFKNIPQINDAYKIYLTQMQRYAAYREHINDSAKYTVILGRGLSLI